MHSFSGARRGGGVTARGAAAAAGVCGILSVAAGVVGLRRAAAQPEPPPAAAPQNAAPEESAVGGPPGTPPPAGALRGCCIGSGCSGPAAFDTWCAAANASCPGIRSGRACGNSRCAPRWSAALPGAVGALNGSTVARCITAMMAAAGLPPPPPPPPGFLPAGLGEPDYPISIAPLRHMCKRPCSAAWPCSGRRRLPAGHYTLNPCWMNFYKPGKHHAVRRHKSLIAVWAPPVVDTISEQLLRKGVYDTRLHSLVRLPLGREPGTVVDVGSNLGVVTLYAAQQGHRVVAFDATPWTRRKLEISAWINGLSERVRIVPAAAGAAQGAAQLGVLPGNLGGNQLLARREAEAMAEGRPDRRGAVEVSVTTLDAALGGEAPFFIKVDVEGHEIEVLRGAARTLREHHPVLVVETCFWCSPRELFALLQQHQYVCGTEAKLIDRTAVARPGRWHWDVESVLRPEHRHQLRPNVLCIWDPPASARPFDAHPGREYNRSWEGEADWK
eukprot:TRINITY_DN16421_c0_g1_i1.p1 TRINITY_DN16421_c0_g1~~TRINITY_DN16421_c0_g1_i1.p1  ORF type:complete len:535 (+),score=128.50 TRINITY_DN16421_c0_g1_i1:106-1605(+)